MAAQSDYPAATVLLALTRFAGVGPRLLNALLQHYSDLGDLMKTDVKSLMSIKGMDSDMAQQTVRSRQFLGEADQYQKKLAQRDIQISSRLDDNYPPLLLELNDPPSVLYFKGSMPDRSKKTVAIIGADNATNEGIKLTVRLAQACAQADVQVVSSLGRGIDAAAHLGTKAVDGVSFAVIETGFDSLDAGEAVPLAIDIIANGGVISEYPPEERLKPDALQDSNRLLVGLAHGVVVTEMYSDSTRALDIMSFCSQIGKLSFFLMDAEQGSLSDEKALERALRSGAIPMIGLSQIDTIIRSLV